MKIGIPKALLYYRYNKLWRTFFEELGCEVVLSDKTNKQTLNVGANYAIDESCLPYKIYLGHIVNLFDKCDYILIPRIATYADREIVCTRFQAVYDIIQNTFRDQQFKVLDYNIDVVNNKTEKDAFLEMGKQLGKTKKESLVAYIKAKATEKEFRNNLEEKQNQKLKSDKIKLLIVSHPYNIYDDYIGEPVTKFIEELDCIPIYSDIVDRKLAHNRCKEILPTLQWTFNKELVGAIELYKDDIDGIVLMTAFPCGPDSLVNEMIIRKVTDIPVVTLILDMQEGTAGRETRLESFVDIIKLKKEEKEHERIQS